MEVRVQETAAFPGGQDVVAPGPTGRQRWGLGRAQHKALCVQSAQRPLVVGSGITPIIQMKELRLRELQKFFCSNLTSKPWIPEPTLNHFTGREVMTISFPAQNKRM